MTSHVGSALIIIAIQESMTLHSILYCDRDDNYTQVKLMLVAASNTSILIVPAIIKLVLNISGQHLNTSSQILIVLGSILILRYKAAF